MSGFSSDEVWLLIGLVALAAAAMKALGPLLLGGRELPPRLVGVVVLLPSALLSALVVTTGFADGSTVRVGAVTAGVLTGGVLLLLRAPLIVAVLVAAVLTAALRAFGLS